MFAPRAHSGAAERVRNRRRVCNANRVLLACASRLVFARGRRSLISSHQQSWWFTDGN